MQLIVGEAASAKSLFNHEGNLLHNKTLHRDKRYTEFGQCIVGEAVSFGQIPI